MSEGGMRGREGWREGGDTSMYMYMYMYVHD